MAGPSGILVGVAAVAVGVGGAMLVLKGDRGAGAEGGSSRAVAAVSAAEVSDLAADLKEARRTISSLERDLDGVSRSVAEARAENARLRKTVDGLIASAKAAPMARPAEETAGSTSASAGTPLAAAPPASGLDAGAAAAPYGTSIDTREAEIKTVLAKIEGEKKEQERAREQKRQLEGAKRRVSEIADRLSLAPDQSEKFAVAMFERDTKQGEMWQKAREEELPREAMREQGEAIQKAYEATLQQVLSPAQYAELQKYREEQNRPREGREGGGPGGPGGGRRGGQ